MTAILKVDTIQDTAGNNIINESSDTITIGASGDTTNIVGTLQNIGSAISIASLSTASGSAPSYSARAWVNFNGTGTVGIRASGNISSISDLGTGNYDVNFGTINEIDLNIDIEAGDDIGITMGDYEGDKAIIYDRNRNQIGVQVARSKTGPGGAMQDTILYHKDFQLCLAKETKLQGKCG